MLPEPASALSKETVLIDWKLFFGTENWRVADPSRAAMWWRRRTQIAETNFLPPPIAFVKAAAAWETEKKNPPENKVNSFLHQQVAKTFLQEKPAVQLSQNPRADRLPSPVNNRDQQGLVTLCKLQQPQLNDKIALVQSTKP